MALIKCPECGAQISDAAKQCVHCGCIFKVCPECGKVHKGEPAVCDNCGYAFQEKPKQETPVQATPVVNSVLSKDNYIALWESESSLRKKRNTIYSVLSIAFGILIVVWIALAYWKLSSWMNGDPLEGLVNAKETLSSIQVFVVLTCVCIFYTIIDGTLWSTYGEISLGNWLYKHHIDAAAGIKKYYEIATDEETLNGNLLTKAAYLSAVPSANSREYIMLGLLGACAAGFVISLGVCAVQNLEFFMTQTVILSEAFQFQYTALIPAVIFIVAYAIIYFAGYRAIEKQKDKWLEVIAPGLSEVISNKLSDLVERS